MRALTVGSAMIDTIAVIANDHIEQMSMRNADTTFLLLEEGSKTDAEQISTHAGGGAINAAVSMARQGHDVACLAKIGDDQRAATLLSRLADERVDSRWIVRQAEVPTGASVMVSSHDRNAAIFTYRGANTTLVPADLPSAAFDVDLVYIASLSNRSADCFGHIVKSARAAKAMVATNPGIRQLSAKGGAVLDSLPEIDLLLMNRVEAEALIAPLVSRHGETWRKGMAARELPEPALRPLSNGGFQVAVTALMATLTALGVKRVAITLGRHGALLQSAGELLHCPAVTMEAPAGTAGAGDAFSSTLCAFLAGGADTGTALRSAAINAASVVGHTDTQSGLLSAAQLSARSNELERSLLVKRWQTS